MVYLAVDADGTEWIFDNTPVRSEEEWNTFNMFKDSFIGLPKGSIAKLIGRDLTWCDEPVELTNE